MTSAGRGPRGGVGRRARALGGAPMRVRAPRRPVREFPARAPRAPAWPRTSSVEPRVEGVAQTVAEEVEPEHRQDQREAREEDEIRSREELAAVLSDHRAPFGEGRL